MFHDLKGPEEKSLSKIYLPPQKKVLVIPRKRWLRPNMTEKLFTGTLSIKPNHKKVSRKKLIESGIDRAMRLNCKKLGNVSEKWVMLTQNMTHLKKQRNKQSNWVC